VALLVALGSFSGAAAQASSSPTPAPTATPSSGFDLKQAWLDVLSDPPNYHGYWAEGVGERYGQVCDPWRQPDTEVWPVNDDNMGCVAVWLSQRGDDFTVGDLPRDQQNNFQNTLHYHSAWNYNIGGFGFKGDTLPQAGIDIDPVCYVANISGTMSLGYEEGNGDKLLPCPGARGGYDFPEDMILNASDEKLKSMCNACYQSVCSRQYSRYPRSCGGSSQGGVDIEDDHVQGLQQVSSAYHCHLTMANDGACDYVQYDQHEESRHYNMSSGVICGWKNVKYLNLTYCDCTREAGRANNCQAAECLKMALNGVVCGNCGQCNQDTAYRQIFSPFTGKDDSSKYDGVCAMATTADTEELRANYTRLCSQGLYCRSARNDRNCRFHCEMFPESEVCSAVTGRKLLQMDDEEKDDMTDEEKKEMEEIYKRFEAAGLEREEAERLGLEEAKILLETIEGDTGDADPSADPGRKLLSADAEPEGMFDADAAIAEFGVDKSEAQILKTVSADSPSSRKMLM